MEYGTQGWFPNGTHPVGAVFVDIDPALADFNIHPAKREARFKDSGAIHHAVQTALRDFCRHRNLAGSQVSEKRQSFGDTLALEVEDLQSESKPANSDTNFAYDTASYAAAPSFVNDASGEAKAYGEVRYAGRAFGFFIMAERGDTLYIIDQHAAHERILYDQFLAGRIPKQELLIPLVFNTESDEDDRFLEAKREELGTLSIAIEREGSGWRIDALPAGWRLSDAQTIKEILDLRNAGENIAMRWAATFCCHHAIREGDYLDDDAALALAQDTLALPDPRCHHGRPALTEISREALYKAVRRK
jgi:DNA mismatch repair protein MutL